MTACAVSIALTFVFWWQLWFGAGFVGGDLYPYYFPQKQFLADSLHRGELPLWNSLTGHGYPVLGESQTGAIYPLHWLTYGLCDVQSAWNAVHIVHYIAAFLAMWLFARRSGLALGGALLAATVYVYGWFPARACLEWAILGGVYLPLSLWCVEGYLQSRRAAFLAALGLALGLQLLGGHYQIAFYTWLVLAIYVPARLWMTSSPEAHGPRPVGFLCTALILGILLGGAQLLPTWELKQRSQRTAAGAEHDPNYGHIPPQYLSQLVNPWRWYDPQRDLDTELNRLKWAALAAGTNRVEAHLYVGQIPIYLALGGVIVMALRALVLTRQNEGDPPQPPLGRGGEEVVLWLLVTALATLVAVGWLQPVLAHVPGFNYFRGLGRIGIVITLGLALLAGRAFDDLLAVAPPALQHLLAVALLGITIVDLAWWPAAINYAVIVPNPPIRARDASPIRAALLAEPQQPVRLFAPGANIANLLGVASTPVYLGLGPREYFDPQFTIPRGENDDFHAFTPERQDWLLRAGVTHILCFEPLEQRGWSVEPLWTGFDPLLNPAWARFQEPLYLYRLRNAPGRIYWQDADGPRPLGSSDDTIEIAQETPQRLVVNVSTPESRRLVLTDLAYPGWQTRVDGRVVATETAGMFRAVEIPPGRHTVDWSYRPRSVYWGLLVSGLGAAGLGLLTWAATRRLRKPE